jgi:hypothetical protein
MSTRTRYATAHFESFESLQDSLFLYDPLKVEQMLTLEIVSIGKPDVLENERAVLENGRWWIETEVER